MINLPTGGSATLIIADVFDGLLLLPDQSVDLVLTSPPFLGLRSYSSDSGEIGQEKSPADYLDAVLDVMEAVSRVLCDDGSVCIEIGDTYSNGGEDWPLTKSLTGVPTLFAWSLAYGYNMLRPERSVPRWIVRNVVVWCRPNPMPGSLGDKFRPATSYLTIATKSESRYFDLDSVRRPPWSQEVGWPSLKRKKNANYKRQPPSVAKQSTEERPGYSLDGVPPLDYWDIPTEPYHGAHHAVWPPELLMQPVKAMCPPGGVVLDPFVGSGTTLAVATGHGRNAIGIDIDPRNIDLVKGRVGMFLSVETPSITT